MVTDKSGKIFDDRRKESRRKNSVSVATERRTEIRRNTDKQKQN